MSRYFITGIGGFVGRYFTEYLRANESEAEISGADIMPECSLPVKYTQLNLNDAERTNAVMAEIRPDYVVHLASISSVGQSWQNPRECFENNTGIMLNILEAVRNSRAKTRVLAIGSSEEYGDYAAAEMPLKEEYRLKPQNPYAVAKTGQEELCRLYAKSLNADVVMTRSFNHIGPRQSERFVVPSFMRQLVNISRGAENKMLVGNIEVARDFTDVRDVVDAYYKILHGGKSGEVYNVCSGKAVTLREVIRTAAAILEIEPEIVTDAARLRPNDTPLVLGDNTKLRALGWKPEFALRQTITDILNSMK